MDQNLIDRFYKGECTPEEVKTVLKWFESQQLTAEQEVCLRAIWKETTANQGLEENGHDVEKTWHAIKASITGNQPQELEGKVLPMARETPWGKWARVAAAIVLPLGFLWFMASQYFKDSPEAGRMVAVHAAPGERKTIQLEDGSTIVLRPGSSVTYQKPFATDRRDISLEGEAFFQVAKDKQRPFVVKSGAISTQALGTSFNIRYLPKDTAVSIALATGLVKVSREETKGAAVLAKLVPGQQLVFNRKNQRHAVGAFTAREVLGWKDGILHFKKASLEEVVTSLENWYGVQIDVKGAQAKAIEEWSYTGEYVEQPLTQVLEGIGFVKQFSYTQQDKHVQIIFNRP